MGSADLTFKNWFKKKKSISAITDGYGFLLDEYFLWYSYNVVQPYQSNMPTPRQQLGWQNQSDLISLFKSLCVSGAFDNPVNVLKDVVSHCQTGNLEQPHLLFFYWRMDVMLVLQLFYDQGKPLCIWLKPWPLNSWGEGPKNDKICNWMGMFCFFLPILTSGLSSVFIRMIAKASSGQWPETLSHNVKIKTSWINHSDF